jgi:VWFA-related protein
MNTMPLGDDRRSERKTSSLFFKIVMLLFMALAFLSLILSATRASENPRPPGQAAKPQESLQHEVTVTLKLVQVFVLDRKGNPALDLEKSDFVLYDNGKLQPISGFEKHFLSGPKVTVEESKLPPGRDMASLMNRKFIFLIDYARNDLKGIMMSKNAALDFMNSKVQPGEEVALFSFSTISGLTLHEYLTTDHDKVKAAIKKLRDTPGVPVSEDFTGFGHEPMGMELMSLQVMGGHGFAGAGNRNFFSEVKELAKALGHIPGQKNIILFSSGFGTNIVNPRTPDSSFLKDMAQELASANAPVFSVNTDTTMAHKVKTLADGSLDYLSKVTGGKYVGDVDYYARNATDIQSTTSNYYVLAYSIEVAWDGKFHDIKVEVKRPGYKVYGQKGYYGPVPFNRLSLVEKHFQLIDLALGEKSYFGQSLNFPLAALPFAGGKDTNIVLLAEIPVTRLRQDVGDNTELISLILNENKTIIEGKRVEMNWGTVRGEKACQYSVAKLGPGRYECRVIIRNLEDGRGAVGACSVEIPETPAVRFRIFPPLLLAKGEEIPYLNVSGEEKNKSETTFSLFRVFPYPAKEYVPLAGGIDRESSEIYGVLRSVWGEPPEPELDITAWLVPDGKQEKIPLTVDILSGMQQEDAEIRFLKFALPGLPPGRYSLHILAEDPASKLSAETRADLRIK